MAKKHVFPVCKPGSKTFVPTNKIDGGVSFGSGVVFYSETEDPEVLFSENTNSEKVLGWWVGLDGTRSEHLADLTSPPDTDLSFNNPYILFFWTWAEDASFDYNKAWSEINRKSSSNPPEPGTVICLGLKDNASSEWRNFMREPLWNSVGPNYPQDFLTLFRDDAADGLLFAEVGQGRWLTIMWTGTRFVALGSNNWY
mgnify:CR=1 FL=1|tara:strand:+ start:133 stop:726 length:594 start_codon:yes stop_codon:yes gene_type:complete